MPSASVRNPKISEKTRTTPAAANDSAPVPAFLTILFLLALFAHAVVGLRSVLDDYVHSRVLRVAADLLVRAIAIILGGASVLAVLKLFLGR